MTPVEPWRVESPHVAPQAHARAGEWVASSALAEVLAAFDATDLPPNASALASWSGRVLDTRAGRERQLVDAVTWREHQVGALLAAAPRLGLVRTPRPTAARYDLTVVMAGTTTANRMRVALAADAAENGVELGTIIGLTSERPIPDWERARHADVAHDFEWADLAAVLATSFGAEALKEAPGDLSDVLLAQRPAGALRLLTAPSDADGRRADSAAAFDHLRDRLGALGRVLVVTSSIYAPYTFFVAVARLGPAAMSVEVIGTETSPDRADAALAQRFGQEIHATLEAITRLPE